MSKKIIVTVFCSFLLVHLLLLANLRFEAWPEMLVYPYLNVNGFSQYRDIIHPYPPLPIWFLGGYFSLAGISIFNLELLTWVIILFIDWLLFYIANKQYGTKAALIALGFFVLWQPLLDGNGLWFDLMLAPILLLAFYHKSPTLLAIAFFFKQTTLFLFPLLFKRWKKLAVSLTFLFLVSCFLFLLNGTLKDYLFWSWRVPLTLYPILPGQKDLGNLRLWIVAIIPFLPLLFSLRAKSTHWALLSYLFIFPRFGLFHLQPTLAFTAISVASSWKKITQHHWFPLFLIPYALFALIMWVRQPWGHSTRFFEPEIIATSKELSQATNPSDPILFINSPDQLMILSQRLPPKPWVDTFPWYLEIPNLQNKIIDQYKTQPIQAIIWSPYQHQGKYIPGSYVPKELQHFVDEGFSAPQNLGRDIFILKPL